MRVRVLVVLLGVACKPPLGTEVHHHRGQIVLSAAAPQTPTGVTGPYVSVLDSVGLTMTPASGSQIVLGRHLSRRDTTASFSVDLQEGTYQFDARVLSAKRAVLYAGTGNSVVDRDGFSVDLSVAPQTPVMLVAPDTSHVVVPTGSLGQTTLVVHNRGIGVLRFSIYDTSQVSRTQCASVACFRPSRLADTVIAGASVAVRIDAIRKFATAIPLTFSSASGDVEVVIHTP
ncbi:MAG: hypothetical protein H7062_14540 [Candidatus Saccharimonas sp.]|nr:hypothetical protein [Planctomycetaceae bacterium]